LKVTVVGAGYVGLVTAACLADVGNDVLCFDSDESRIQTLDAGRVPIYEPGLEQIIARNVDALRLRFTSDPRLAAFHGVVQFIAVGTPPDEDGSADIQHVLAAAESIATHMEDFRVVVEKSTVPVGTADRVSDAIHGVLKARGADVDFAVISNPEFLKEGSAIDDFMRPDRIIIGSDHERATEIMRRLYSPFERNHPKVMVMDVRSAELAKYAANAMLATRISFMNELALLAEKVHADIDWVRRGMGSDPRIGTHFLYAGCGYGGSCFPKDVRALIRAGESCNQPLRVLRAVEEVNEAQKRLLAARVAHALGQDLPGSTIAIWGLAFKPNTDDVRFAPSLALIDDLLKNGANVSAYDPVAMEQASRALGPRAGLTYARRALDAASDADALVIVTEWKEFHNPALRELRKVMRRPIIIDGRNVIDPAEARAAGFVYAGIGRP
jgi:UDPglucose 6-dehydrogenase